MSEEKKNQAQSTMKMQSSAKGPEKKQENQPSEVDELRAEIARLKGELATTKKFQPAGQTLFKPLDEKEAKLFSVSVEGNPEVPVLAAHRGEAADLYSEFFGILATSKRISVDEVPRDSIDLDAVPGPIRANDNGRPCRTVDRDEEGGPVVAAASIYQGRKVSSKNE